MECSKVDSECTSVVISEASDVTVLIPSSFGTFDNFEKIEKTSVAVVIFSSLYKLLKERLLTFTMK